MTLLKELIEIPERVHKSDFVISLATAIGEPERTMRDYVVTGQLAECFDRALSLASSAVTDQRSKATYLHASFGAGKTAMMAVLHLLLNGHPAARSAPELQPVVAKYSARLEGKKFLLIPYHFIGKESMEQVVLGGYVDYVQKMHPDAPLPPVYVADGILEDSQDKREKMGDRTFFQMLSEGGVADEWGDYGAGWHAERYEAALAAPPDSSEREQLVGSLLRTHYRAFPGQAQVTAQGFVPLDAGLDVISRHTRALGYDAAVLFLDELVLWLESRMSEVSFVSREGNKIVKLVEADAARRPAPIVSFIARQRDLKDLVGDNVLGPEALSAMDVLRHSEGRFDTITLEDGNLPAIAEKRLLTPRSEVARQELDEAFAQVRQQLDERHERDILLTQDADLNTFRSLYPFSPALVEALVGLSGAMQRERTALKIMLQLLVDGRETLKLGELVPLGDLWDAIDAGDEPLTEVMRNQFAQARRSWIQRLQPMLLREHGIDEEQSRRLPPDHEYVADARLLKTLLIAALVPEVAPLRGLTVSRLTALNSGVVRAFIPGTERQRVLEKLRRWQAEVSELKLGEDDNDPTVALSLTGIDVDPMLEMARVVDNDGARRRRVKDLLAEGLVIKDLDAFEPWAEVVWRGTRRRVDLYFGNVRDVAEVPDESFRAGNHPKIVIDFPWDSAEYGPTDDRSRAYDYRREMAPEWTAVWLPNFLTDSVQRQLGELVRLEYILGGETFDQYASYLSPTDRPIARQQLDNRRTGLRQRLAGALRQAYGIDPVQDGIVEQRLELGEQFVVLDAALNLRPPVGTSLRSHLEDLANQLLAHRFPGHPEFTDLVTRADLNHTLTLVSRALQQPNGRLEDVQPPPMRKVLTRVAGPLRLGTMYQAHFIADLGHWTDLIEQRRAEAGVATMTVEQVRRWLEGADKPAERRGLTPEVCDLLILLFAEATNRVLVDAGRSVAKPEVGKVRSEWELRPQQLPAPAVWEEAVGRAQDMGIVPASTLLSANTVADVVQRIHDELVSDRAQAVRDLVPRLEATYSRLNVNDDGTRLQTARAATGLVDELATRPDSAVEVLAHQRIPSSAAALGTSIKQSAGVTAELQRANWELIEHALELPDPWEGDAKRLAERLRTALVNDELATALVPALREATKAATDLMARAAKPSNQGDLPLPADPTNQNDGKFGQEEAELQLQRIRARLRSEAGLDLTWEFKKLENDAPR